MGLLKASGPTLLPYIRTTFPTFSMLFFPEDGDSRFLRSVGNDLPDYTASRTKTLLIVYCGLHLKKGKYHFGLYTGAPVIKGCSHFVVHYHFRIVEEYSMKYSKLRIFM
jgi:hypothetical protein